MMFLIIPYQTVHDITSTSGRSIKIYLTKLDKEYQGFTCEINQALISAKSEYLGTSGDTYHYNITITFPKPSTSTDFIMKGLCAF